MDRRLTKKEMLEAILESVETWEIRDCHKWIQGQMERSLKKLKRDKLEAEYLNSCVPM
jgi:hypothetical protein